MSEKKKLTMKDLQAEIEILDKVTNALNTAVVALCYAVKVKGNELDKVSSDDYVKFVAEHVHPLVKRADDIVCEVAKKAVEELNKEEKDGE